MTVTLEINGRRVEVGDEFRNLSPEEQQRTVSEIASQMQQSQTSARNPDGTYGQPPEGFVLNPRTGQMEDMRSPNNPYVDSGRGTAAAQGLGQGLSFGFMDEAVGGLYGATGPGTFEQNYDYATAKMREELRRARKDYRGTTTVSEIGGSVLGALAPGGLVGKATTKASAALPAALTTMPKALSGGEKLASAARLGLRVGQSVAAGAGFGALYGFGAGEGSFDNRKDEAGESALLGAGIGLAAPLVGAGLKGIGNRYLASRALRKAGKAANSAAQIRGDAAGQYKAFEDAGAEISPDALSRLRQTLEERLGKIGYNLPGSASLTPEGQKILGTIGLMDDQVRKAAAAGENPAVPLRGLEDLRRLAGDVAQDVNKIGRPTRDAAMGSTAVDEIDNFIAGLSEADVPIGDVGAARDALSKARKLWSQASKTQALENVLDQQDNYLGGSASAIRNRVATLLRNPKTARQFTDAEKHMLRRIIGGNPVSRALRLAGNGIGRTAMTATGAATGGIPGSILGMLTGELTGEIANRNAVRAAETARNVIANGGLQSLPQVSGETRKMLEALFRRAGITTHEAK